MTTIICFNLIPEALKATEVYITIIGMLLGVSVMILCDSIIKGRNTSQNSLLKVGIIIGVGLSLHNFPEGLAIGSSFGIEITLGYSLAIAIFLHDIPEGVSMAVPMKAGGMNKYKVLVFTILSGVTTGIGAFFGGFLGNVSKEMIGVSLAFAAGAMLYIISSELIPESKKLYRGRNSIIRKYFRFYYRYFSILSIIFS